jgi:threonine dehydratase
VIPETWLDEAAARLEGVIDPTPLLYDDEFNLYLKLENHQKTGSFKVRGAFNKVLSLEPWELERGIVTASAGNHGQGVALAGQQVGARVEVFVSENAVSTKVEAMRTFGAEVHMVPGGYAEAEKNAIAYSMEHRATWISPYNDGQVIAGQGTLGLEILAQVQEPFPVACVVPVGGGGLISGIGAAFQRSAYRIALIGIQSEASAFMQSLFQNGSQDHVIEQESIADGLEGAVEANSITIPMVRKYVDGFELVREDEIARAVATAWYRYNERIEGSAAVALAAAMSHRVAERPAVVVLTGKNIQPEVHAAICERWQENLFRHEEI